MVLSTVFIVLALAGCAYALLAAVLVSRARPGRGGLPARDAVAYPSISILKPLHGSEPNLLVNLATFVAQDYPGPVEIIFGVGEGSDPATLAVHRLKAEYPDRDITLVVDGRRRGQNGKVSNLMNMAEHARHEVVVLADSDMMVRPDYLRRLAEAIAVPGVGAVTCLYRGVSLPNLWSRLAVQWIDHHFLPSVLVGMALGLAKPCFGSTIALRRETLEAMGGFAAFKDVLADDYAMGEAVRRLGLAVVMPKDLVLGHLCAPASASAMIRQELRWTRTIRAVDPAGFMGSIVTHPIPLATLAVLWSGFESLPLACLAAALGARLVLQLSVARFLGSRPSGLILGPVRDYAAFLIFVTSFWPGSVDWRGHRFRLQSDGTLASSDIAGS